MEVEHPKFKHAIVLTQDKITFATNCYACEKQVMEISKINGANRIKLLGCECAHSPLETLNSLSNFMDEFKTTKITLP